jgi:hypothetical protein
VQRQDDVHETLEIGRAEEPLSGFALNLPEVPVGIDDPIS